MSTVKRPAPVEEADQISITAVARAIRRNRALICLVALAAGSAAGVRAAIRPTSYTASALFKPQAQQYQQQGIAGLASQIGLSLPFGSTGMTPQAYADLAVSQEILRPVAESHFSYRVGRRLVSGTLADLYSPGHAPVPEKRDATVGMLTKQIAPTVSKTGAVVLKVTTPYPELSQQLAATIIDQIDSLNVRTQQGHATAERAFVEERVAVAEAELRQAEGRLAAFLESNRQYNTPQLQLDRDRLSRDVTMRQQLYTSLVEAYQRARIDEVRNMPAITVLESAELPYAPDSRRTISMVVLGLALGTVLGLFIAFIRDTWEQLRRVVQSSESGDGDETKESDFTVVSDPPVHGIGATEIRSARG